MAVQTRVDENGVDGALARRLGRAWERLEQTERGYVWLSKLGPAYFFALMAALKLWTLAMLVGRYFQGETTAGLVLLAVHKGVGATFFGLVATLFLLRRRPLKRVGGPVEGLVALVGSYVMLPVALGPTSAVDDQVLLLADGLMAVGTLGAAFALLSLGRCFGIFPEARGLVTRGPYRFVRHPMYLFEFIAFLGVLLPSLSPLNLGLYGLFVASQLGRMHFEERALGETFPEYRAYRARTARLVPGLY